MWEASQFACWDTNSCYITLLENKPKQLTVPNCTKLNLWEILIHKHGVSYCNFLRILQYFNIVTVSHIINYVDDMSVPLIFFQTALVSSQHLSLVWNFSFKVQRILPLWKCFMLNNHISSSLELVSLFTLLGISTLVSM